MQNSYDDDFSPHQVTITLSLCCNKVLAVLPGAVDGGVVSVRNMKMSVREALHFQCALSSWCKQGTEMLPGVKTRFLYQISLILF